MAEASGESVHLREVTNADLPVLFEHQRDPDSVRMAAFPPRDREAFDAHWAKLLSEPDFTPYAIEWDGRLAGYIGSWSVEKRRLIGYWIGQEYWGRGIATAALRAFLNVEPFRPLTAFVAKHNAASIRVLQKCGFGLASKQPEGPGEDGIEELIFELRE